MQKLQHLLLPLLLFFTFCSTAQTVPPTLDSLLNRTLDSMLLVVNAKGFGGAVQLPNGAGISSASPLEAVGDDHAFNIGSVTKTITAGCILQMADEGILSLSDSLHEWLDTFQYTQLKTTVATPFNGGTRYGLGIMERNFQTYKGYGHGGDAGYSASAWYFPTQDVSVAVLNNDGRRNSWTLAPVVLALLKTYIQWETTTVAAPEAMAQTAVPMQVMPNPFSDELRISVKIPTGISEVRVLIYNALGEKVAGEQISDLPAGEHTFQLASLRYLPAGLYFTTLLVDGEMAGIVKVVKR